MDWVVRRLEEADEDAFLAFLGHRINDRSVAAHFDWLYRSNPHGDAITWIAALKSDGRIVGCTSVFPRRMMLCGTPVLGSFGGDAYVNPEFRRQGIGQALHDDSVPDMEELGVQCNYGCPSPANFRAFVRVGALSPCRFLGFRLPLISNAITGRFRLGPFRSAIDRVISPFVSARLARHSAKYLDSGTSIQIVEHFENSVDTLFDSVACELGVCCSRDAAYLNWRFADHPFKNYTLAEFRNDDALAGYAVLALTTNQCRVIDFVARNDKDVGMSCISAIVALAQENEKASIFVRLNPDGPYSQLFGDYGFVKREQSNPFMVLTLHDPEMDRYFDNGSSWFLMLGDDDTH